MQNVQSTWLENNLWFNSALNDLDSYFYYKTIKTPGFISTLSIIDEQDEDDYYIDIYYN